MDKYEQKLFESLANIIELAKANSGGVRDITIETSGHDPHASMTLPAYVLEKFITQAN